MRIEELMQKNKGKIVTISAVRPLRHKELNADNKDRTILKHCIHNSQWAVDRDRKKAVIEARANGTLPSENQGLKGREWVSFPFVQRSLRTGEQALVVYPAKNGSKVRFTEDGNDVSYEEYVSATIPSLHKKKDGSLAQFPLVFSSIESIRIGGKTYTIDRDGEVYEMA